MCTILILCQNTKTPYMPAKIYTIDRIYTKNQLAYAMMKFTTAPIARLVVIRFAVSLFKMIAFDTRRSCVQLGSFFLRFTVALCIYRNWLICFDNS